MFSLNEIFTFSLSQEIDMAIRLLAAAILGIIIGFERRYADKPAGLRTLALVATGAALFTIVSEFGFPGGDPGRVAAQIVSGIGFLGAGIIFLTGGNRVRGLTTAASVWITAAVGMAAGAGLYIVAVTATALALIILHVIPSRRDTDEDD
jgi:putative Mg2+ transporter-C (MgtC) family protein